MSAGQLHHVDDVRRQLPASRRHSNRSAQRLRCIARIAAAYPPSDAEKTGELAKLLYRLRKADVVTLSEKAAAKSAEPAVIGDAVAISGQVQAVRNIAVPAKLVDFLELKSFQEVIIQPTGEPAGVTTCDYIAAVDRCAERRSRQWRRCCDRSRQRRQRFGHRNRSIAVVPPDDQEHRLAIA